MLSSGEYNAEELKKQISVLKDTKAFLFEELSKKSEEIENLQQ